MKLIGTGRLVRTGLFTAYCSVNYRTIWSKTRINCAAGVGHCRSQWVTVRLSMKRAVLARGDSTYRCRSAGWGGVPERWKRKCYNRLCALNRAPYDTMLYAVWPVLCWSLLTLPLIIALCPSTTVDGFLYDNESTSVVNTYNVPIHTVSKYVFSFWYKLEPLRF